MENADVGVVDLAVIHPEYVFPVAFLFFFIRFLAKEGERRVFEQVQCIFFRNSHDGYL